MMSPLMATSVRRFDAWLRMVAGTALLLALSSALGAQGPSLFSREWYAQFSGPYSQPLEPFRIVGNIYYVGAQNIASYLIATPQGHILIDSGTTEMHDGIVGGVERFGDVASVRVSNSTEEVEIGDRLVPAPRETVVNYVPHPPARPVDGHIIAAARDAVEFGRGSIVTIDRGARDGLDIGAVLAIYRVVPPIVDPRPSKEPDRIAQWLDVTTWYQPERFVHVPDERTGLMFVFRVFDRVSYAVVLNTTDSINLGDWVRQP